MLDAPHFTLIEENTDSFQALIDEPYLTLIREEGVYVCQVHLPWDLGDLQFELGRLGFVAEDSYSEGGVLEMKLRKLGDISLDTEHHHYDNKEKIYA